MALIARTQPIEWTAVPFRAGPEALQALLAGHADAIAEENSSWAPLVEAGRLRLFATFGAERSARFPTVPTLREFGGEWSAYYPYGIVGPRGVEPANVGVLHDAFRVALSEPASAAPSRLRAAFAAVLGVAPERYGQLRRLTMVRAALLAVPPRWTSVADAAEAHGFGARDGFSRADQNMFSEHPSRTLRRGCY